MLKLAVLCSIDSWGGLEMNTLRLCKWLHERGNEIVFLGKPDSRLMSEVQKTGIQTLEFTQKQKHLNINASKRLAKLLEQHQIEQLLIAHYYQFYTGILSKSFSKNPLKVVYWQQMQMTSQKKDPYHGFFYKRLDAWITPLEYLRQQLLQSTNISQSKIKIIPLCIEVAPFVEASKMPKAVLKKKFRLQENDFVLGCIGRLDPIKGQECILQAVKILADKAPDMKVLLVGEETYGHEGYLGYLKNLIQKLDLEDKVIFHPFVENTAAAFRALDVFVMSSLAESFGMVTIEALATATPVIGTDSGGTPDLLAQGKIGLLTPPKDAQALAEAVFKLYQDAALRNKMAQEAQKNVLDKYTHTLQCEGFEAVFKAISQK